MKDKDINIFDYDKLVFVDASGDDGFSFREKSGDGSSFTFVVSCLVIESCDFEYNCNILNQMKDTLNIPRERELKSTTLKRHRFSQNAYEKLANIKGDVFSFVAFKKALLKSNSPSDQSLCNTETKELSGLIHSFPIYALTKTGILEKGSHVLIIIDHLKKTESESIAEHTRRFDIPSLINSDTIYRDSKSEKFPLIQLADAICGSVRQYFERTLNVLPIQRFCLVCLRQKSMCTKGPALKAWKANYFTKPEMVVLKLHRNRFFHNNIMMVSITTIAFQYHQRHHYIDCAFGDNKKRS